MSDVDKAMASAGSNAPQVSRLVVDAYPAETLAALFDDGLAPPQHGETLPPLWHWAAFPRWTAASQTGRDGHPRTGGFLPDLGKPRRMFAGGRVEMHGLVRVGEQLRIEERVLSILPKSGRQGDFFLVQAQLLVFDDRGVLAMSERRDLVYRDGAAPEPRGGGEGPSAVSGSAEGGRPLLSRLDGAWIFATDPMLLMRFSSATSNGHRIHYDVPYATRVEGYPGLVVHGPLMAMAMAEVLRLEGVVGVETLTHRNLRPLFCGQDATIEVTQNEVGLHEVTVRREGQVHAVLTAGRSDHP